MVYNWHQIGRCTWSRLFTFLRQARNHLAMAGFSIRKNGRFFIRGKSIDYNLYPYVVLTTKAKHQQLRGTAKEKLSYTAWSRNVLTRILPWNPKHSTFLPQQLFCASPKKQSNCFGSMVFPFYRASRRLEPVIKCCPFLSCFQRLVCFTLWQNHCHSDFTWGNRRHSRQR